MQQNMVCVLRHCGWLNLRELCSLPMQEAYETGVMFGPYKEVILLTIDTCTLNKQQNLSSSISRLKTFFF